MPSGSTWEPDNGYTNYWDSYFRGGGGSLQAVYGGGSFSGSLGGFTKVDLPGKQRSGWIWQPGDFQIHLPEITGWEWVSGSTVMESGFPEMADISWIHEPIDNIYGEATSRVSMRGNDIISSYPPGYSISAFEGNSGELRQWKPSGVHNWSRSNNFFASLSYDLVNGISVTAQSFLRGPYSVHLTGELVKGNDRVDAFVNTASWVLLSGEISTFKYSRRSGGFISSKYNLRLQAHTHPRSPLKGRGATGTISPFHININKVHIYPNPRYWKYYYRFWKF